MFISSLTPTVAVTSIQSTFSRAEHKRIHSAHFFRYMIIATLGIFSLTNSLSHSFPVKAAFSISSRVISRTDPSFLVRNNFKTLTLHSNRVIFRRDTFPLHKNSFEPSRIRLCASKVTTVPATNTNTTQAENSILLTNSNTNENENENKILDKMSVIESSSNDSHSNGDSNNHACAKLMSSNEASLKLCAKRLSEDNLVSFPTETVYGLGCNALSPDAVHKVFQAKRRPFTDPLIVHVLNTEAALPLWNITETSSTPTKKVLIALADHFFPGPLTIVAKSNTDLVPDIITAGTGFVAVRSPSHPVARKLIQWSGVPIAAPSANRFGHVSPTKAFHVMDDLAKEDVWVVNDKDEDGANGMNGNYESPCCDVGVESTVAKVDETNNVVSVLRQGAVSAKEIQECLDNAGLGDVFKVDVRVKTTSEQVANIAPGQTVRHYSPDVLSFMISEKRWQQENPKLAEQEIEYIKNAVVLDFGEKLSFLADKCLAYRDLSKTGNSKEGAVKVFDSLRWAEQVLGAERVYFPEIAADDKTDALTLALKDRLTRAASGVVIEELQ